MSSWSAQNLARAQWNPAGVAMQPVMNSSSFSPGQWAIMQQQNWQQWTQWQQQYSQWQNQYGGEYAQQLQAVQSMGSIPPPPPSGAVPPPPPDKPPPPPPHENNQPLFNSIKEEPLPSNPLQQRNISNFNTNTGTGNNKRSYSTDNQQPPAVNDEDLKKLTEEERLFDIQFQKWEGEIDIWRRENGSHPDKQAYKDYEAKFEACRKQLLERRHLMKMKRASLLNNPQAPAKSTGNTSVAPPPSKSSNQNIYSQNLQSQNSQNNNYERQCESSQSSNKGNINIEPQDRCESYNQNVSEKNNYPSQENHESQGDDKSDNSTFLPAQSTKGIPGLDLAPDSHANKKQGSIDISDDDPKSKNERATDYSTISMKINNILGDEKIMNVLRGLKPAQDPEAGNATQNIVNNDNPQFSPSNQGNRNENFMQPQQYGDRQNSMPNRQGQFSQQNQDMNSQFQPPNYNKQNRTYQDNQYGGPNSGGPNMSRGPHGSGGPSGPMGTGPSGSYGPGMYQGSPVMRPSGPGMRPSGPGMQHGGPGGMRPSGPGMQHGGPVGMRSSGPGMQHGGPGAMRPSGPGMQQGGPGGMRPSGPGMQQGGPGGMMPSGPGMQQGGPGGMMPSGPGMHQGGPGGMRPSRPGMQQGGPGGMRPNGPGMQQGGPGGLRLGGPGMQQGGPGMRQCGPNMQQGGPNMQQGGPNMQQGGTNMHQGGPNMQQGGPNMSQGGPNMQQGGPNMHRGGPNMQQGGPNMHQGGPNMQQGGPNMNQGSPNMQQPQPLMANRISLPIHPNNVPERSPLQDVSLQQNADFHGGPHRTVPAPQQPKPSWVEVPLFTPSIVVEYEHKSLRLKARDFIEPVHTFDYNHISKDDELKKKDFEREADELFTRKPRRSERDYAEDRFRDQGNRDLYQMVYEKRGNRDDFRDMPRDIREEARDMREPRDMRDFRDMREPRDIRGEPRDMRELRDFKDLREPRDARREELKGFRETDRVKDETNRRDWPRDESKDEIERRRDDRKRDDLDRYGNRRVVNSHTDSDRYSNRDRRDGRRDDRDIRRDENRMRSTSKDKDSRKRGTSRDSDVSSHSKKPKDAVAPTNPIVMIDDLLEPPGRSMRPEKIAIIIRGLPGSGKSYLAKLIRDREAEHGGAARIMSIDDYFMQEGEIEETDPTTGKTVKKPSLTYEYDAAFEEMYMNSLKRAFKRTLTDGYFSFLIYDAVNANLQSYAELWNQARQNGFQVYICTMEHDVQACFKRNIHGRSLQDIEEIFARFFPTPAHHIRLDATTLLQSAAITDVHMEDAEGSLHDPALEDQVESVFTSKWEKMDDADKLARLDGTSKPLRPSQLSMEEYLQLDDWTPSVAKPGKKTVRWADIEERRQQEKMRAIGFVVGQTDWNRMTDPTMGSSALTQTKYIERTKRS